MSGEDGPHLEALDHPGDIRRGHAGGADAVYRRLQPAGPGVQE